MQSGRVTVAGHPSAEMDEGTLKSIFSADGRAEMIDYAVVYEQTATGLSAYAPDLPGLGVAGLTFEETELLIRDGIAFHIEGLRADNEPVPLPTTRVARMPISA